MRGAVSGAAWKVGGGEQGVLLLQLWVARLICLILFIAYIFYIIPICQVKYGRQINGNDQVYL